ncbi:retropepsin-like aspartic protease [Sphingobacterium psychroaquaticum]|nr:retropepsin-like aspartic protease [Sphingobacterium psychroaquaticum]
MVYHLKRHLMTFLYLFLVTTVHTVAQENKPVFEALEEAFQQKQEQVLLPYLSGSFAVAGNTGEGAQYRLKQILTNYSAVSVKVLANRKVKKGMLYDVQFTQKDGKIDKSQALLDSDGKLMYITLFDWLYGLRRESESRLLAKIPFENYNGSIILTLKINTLQRPIRLLFDTGADGMAVSQHLADEIGLKVTRENNASVVGGNKQIQVSDGNTVYLDTLTLTGMGIAIFPEMGRDHAEGIIGNTLLRKYITHIDYDNNVMSLYSFGEHSYSGEGHTVAVTMPSGVMLLPGQLDIVESKSYSGNFVFDTGASYDLICFRPFVRSNKLLVSGFKPEVQAATISMGISSPTFMGKSYQFAVSPLVPMKGLLVTLMGGSSNNESWNPGADGSIGIRLLSRYNMTINVAENEVFFQPNKLYPFPQDFVLGGFHMGWDNKGQLVVLGTTGMPSQEGTLKVGDVIHSIAEHSSQSMQKKPAVIDQFCADSKAGNKIQIKLLNNTVISL